MIFKKASYDPFKQHNYSIFNIDNNNNKYLLSSKSAY